MRTYLLPFLCFLSIATNTNGQIITAYAGNGLYGNTGDGGPATAARMEYVWFNALDTSGNMYITDNFDHRVRKVSAAGIMSTFAGNGSAGFTGDGNVATAAQFIGAAGIAADKMGNVYFSDINNRRIRKVNAAGIISTIAGNGSAGFSGDGGPATSAQLNTPYGIAVDDAGNVYVADELNFRVRKISAAGIISTVAGSNVGGYAGDGGAATAAELTPLAVAVDNAGNLFVTTNNRVRKVSTSGIITTVAGNGIAGYSGDGGTATTAKLNQPVGVAVDGLGGIFIADQYNNRIRKVSPSGIISTIAGNGTGGNTGDGGPATAAELLQPLGICLDPSANVYFSDYGNLRVRKIVSGNHIPVFAHGALDSIYVCENSMGDSLHAILTASDADSGQTLTWTVVAPPLHGATSGADTLTDTGSALSPRMVYVPATGYSGRDTFKVRVDDGASLDTITIYVNVKPLPDTGIIVGNSTVCMGTPDTLTDTVSGAVWTSVNARATVSAGIVNGLAAGTDTILATYTVNGCSASASFPVTVYPVSDTITGPGAVCTGLTIDLSGLPGGGSWSVTNTLASVVGGVVTGDTAGVDTVIYTISNACGIFTTLKPVVVIGFTIPSLWISANPARVTPGNYDTLVAHITSGGGITYGYQWERNSTIIPGAIDSVYISNVLAEGDSMTCFITNGPCNFQTFSWTYILYHNAGVGGVANEGGMRLAPDPSNGTFSLEGTMPAGVNDATIVITDFLGNTVFSEHIYGTGGRISHNINVDRPAGLYVLHLYSGSIHDVMRFTIVK